jgi:hypothetical protein
MFNTFLLLDISYCAHKFVNLGLSDWGLDRYPAPDAYLANRSRLSLISN